MEGTRRRGLSAANLDKRNQTQVMMKTKQMMMRGEWWKQILVKTFFLDLVLFGWENCCCLAQKKKKKRNKKKKRKKTLNLWGWNGKKREKKNKKKGNAKKNLKKKKKRLSFLFLFLSFSFPQFSQQLNTHSYTHTHTHTPNLFSLSGNFHNWDSLTNWYNGVYFHQRDCFTLSKFLSFFFFGWPKVILTFSHIPSVYLSVCLFFLFFNLHLHLHLHINRKVSFILYHYHYL